jgi:hypothetical protein
MAQGISTSSDLSAAFPTQRAAVNTRESKWPEWNLLAYLGTITPLMYYCMHTASSIYGRVSTQVF